MTRRSMFLLALITLVMLCATRSPAPLVYTPGEGWTYESYGSGGKWRKEQAKEQLQVSQEAFDNKDYSLAAKSSAYLLRKWPLSDYAPTAQYLLARCHETQGNDEKAFNEYQLMFTKYPKSDKLNDALERQYEIGLRFLAGQRFRLWGYIPFLPSMEKTAGLFEKIVSSGPYSEVAPKAQLQIGTAYDKDKNFPEAVHAYERAADRYHDRPAIAAEALYRAGMAYYKQAQTAEYDQGTAGQAIATFTDLIVLFPQDARVAEVQKLITAMKDEQARGNFQIAEFYAKQKKWNGALVYYNEVLLNGPNSPYANTARERIDAIKQRLPATPASQ